MAEWLKALVLKINVLNTCIPSSIRLRIFFGDSKTLHESILTFGPITSISADKIENAQIRVTEYLFSRDECLDE